MAQQRSLRQVCAADIHNYCAGVKPGEGRLCACVKDNFTLFSEPCKEALLSSVAIVRVCKAEMQNTCAGVQPGGGRIQACIKDHFAEYSDSCKEAIVTAKVGNR